MPDPKLRLSVTYPTVDSLALLVELADHHNLPGETRVIASVLGGPSLSLEVDVAQVWMPTIDWEADQ